MAKIAELTLAAALSVIAPYHEGLQHLEAKRFEKAVRSFSEVIENEAPANAVREQAVYFRARAYSELGKEDKVVNSLAPMLRVLEDSALAENALKLYTEEGGDIEDLLPEAPPIEVWEVLQAAGQAGNKDKFLSNCTGTMRMMMEQTFQHGGGFQHMLEMFNAQPVREEVEESEGIPSRASLIVDFKANYQMEAKFVREEGRWLVASMMPLANGRVQAANVTPEDKVKLQNKTNARVILQALDAHYLDKGTNPDALDGEAKRLFDGETVPKWKHPGTGTERDFAYRAGLAGDDRQSGKMLVLAAPAEVEGTRLVGFLGGRVKRMPEVAFRELAKEQGWALFGLEKDDVDAARKRAIEALIRQLGSREFEERRAAKEKLRSMPEAAPFLEEAAKSGDPEVRMNARELLP